MSDDGTNDSNSHSASGRTGSVSNDRYRSSSSSSSSRSSSRSSSSGESDADCGSVSFGGDGGGGEHDELLSVKHTPPSYAPAVVVANDSSRSRSSSTERSDPNVRGLYVGDTEEEVDASLQEALLLRQQQPQQQPSAASLRNNTDDDDDDDGGFMAEDAPRRSLDDRQGGEDDAPIRWTTSHVGLYRDWWVEKRYDAKLGKWRARWDRLRPESPAAATLPDIDELDADEEAPRQPVVSDTEQRTTADAALLRENARLRSIIRLLRRGGNDRDVADGEGVDGNDDAKRGDVPVAAAPDDDSERRGVRESRPGAFRVPGPAHMTEEGQNEDGSRDDYDPMLPPPPSAPQRSDTILVEATLVHPRKQIRAVAMLIRRKREVISAVIITAVVVGLALGIPLALRRPRPPPTPDYLLIDVPSLQSQFNHSLPMSTLEAIDRGSTPQAAAYRWLFESNNHSFLPQDEALVRLMHRFALATMYFSTGGCETWRARTNWLEKDQHECLWYGVFCHQSTADALAFCVNEFGIPSVSCKLQNSTKLIGIDLSGNMLAGTLPEEAILLKSAELESVRFESNDLAGGIPLRFGELESLKRLSLFHNKLSGTIPVQWGSMSSLLVLELDRNNLTGALPSELSGMSSLTSLSLFDNELTGTIPSQLGLLTRLVELYLHGNRFGGSVPAEVCALLSNYFLLNLTIDCDLVQCPCESGCTCGA
jgi:Leucine rich repeat